MTEQQTYPLELLRAELKSALADQTIQFIDRFASKPELAALETKVAAQQKENEAKFNGIDHKLDLLLDEKNQRDGATGVRQELSSKRIALWVCSISAGATLLGALVSSLLWIAFG